MYETLNEVIENFMMSRSYENMIDSYKNDESIKVKNEFFESMTKISENLSKKKSKELEDIVISYLATVEKTGVLIGFQFAFNLFTDLINKKGGETDV